MAFSPSLMLGGAFEEYHKQESVPSSTREAYGLDLLIISQMHLSQKSSPPDGVTNTDGTGAIEPAAGPPAET